MTELKVLKNEAITELQTLRDMLRWGVSQFNVAGLFFGHGTDNAWDEAVAIALHVLHLPHDIDSGVMDARLTTSERKQIIELFARRIDERLPAAYLTNEAWFAGLKFYVDERVLIPRSPIAELIEKAFKPWIGTSDVHRVLDLCTGSACIAIACAYAFPDAVVDAIDISKDALDVAKINLKKHHLKARLNLIQSDLYTKAKPNQYNVIVSNPPYVAKEAMKQLPKEYTHEPEQGLVAGEEGLDFVDKIIARAPEFLADKGILVVEVGSSMAFMLERYPDLPLIWVDFERGGEGVFMVTKDDLVKYQEMKTEKQVEHD